MFSIMLSGKINILSMTPVRRASDSDFSPIKIYDAATSWDTPVTRACTSPPLDVMAIDNLPSLLPRESSDDFAAQLLPHLKGLDAIDEGVWSRAKTYFDTHIQGVAT